MSIREVNIILRLRTSRYMMRLQQKTQEEKSIKIDQSIQGANIKQMANPSKKLSFLNQQFVIFCDPDYPIYFIESLLQFVKPYINISVSTYVHSTVTKFPNELDKFCSNFSSMNAHADMSLILIWKTVGCDPIMVLSKMHRIQGMVNIARYLNRLIELSNANVLKYEGNGPLYATRIDSYLDTIDSILHGIKPNTILRKIYEKSRYVMGEDISIVDFILESIKRCRVIKN